MGDPSSLTETLRCLEERLVTPAVRRDAEAIGSLLAPAFREIGCSGRSYDRAQILAEVLIGSYTPAIIEDFDATLIAPGLALATYRSHKPGRVCLRSSLWIHSESGWQMLFHQGTLVLETET